MQFFPIVFFHFCSVNRSVTFSNREVSQEFSDPWSQVLILWFRSNASTAQQQTKNHTPDAWFGLQWRTLMLTPRPKHCAHFGAPQCEKNEQQMTNKIPEGTGAHDTGEGCIHLDLLSLEKRMMRGNLTLVCNYVIEVKREPDSSWLHMVGEQEAVDTTQGTGHSNEIQGCYLFSKSGTDYPERPWNFQPWKY